ncbi:MAG: hypothetical protein FWF14_05935 [Streptococcaceae bacterium]|nr:hypothetical protein [Streptococcaceae bacterium]
MKRIIIACGIVGAFVLLGLAVIFAPKQGDKSNNNQTNTLQSEEMSASIANSKAQKAEEQKIIDAINAASKDLNPSSLKNAQMALAYFQKIDSNNAKKYEQPVADMQTRMNLMIDAQNKVNAFQKNVRDTNNQQIAQDAVNKIVNPNDQKVKQALQDKIDHGVQALQNADQQASKQASSAMAKTQAQIADVKAKGDATAAEAQAGIDQSGGKLVAYATAVDASGKVVYTTPRYKQAADANNNAFNWASNVDHFQNTAKIIIHTVDASK